MATNRKAFIVSAAALLLAACVSNSGPETQPAGQRRPPPMTDSQIAVITDPCPLRLQDISGAMLLYFTNHGRTLPKSLEDLRAYMKVVAGTDLLLTCPDSGLPYIYAPDGMKVEDQKWILFVYDAKPSSHGIRWAIVVAPQDDDDHPITMRVVPIDDKTLQSYLNGTLVHPQ